VRSVLRPKLLGTLVLERLFAEQSPLDFFVSSSSHASIVGLVGNADYAAANAFLDEHRFDEQAVLPVEPVTSTSWCGPPARCARGWRPVRSSYVRSVSAGRFR
jgi:hypothetical protein